MTGRDLKPVFLGFAVVCLGTGCGRALGLGTDVVWSSGFESGDLSEWSGPPYESDVDGGQTSVAPTTEQAHTGTYAVRFSSDTSVPWASPYSPAGACLYKAGEFPQSAYYSAWYLIPKFYVTLSSWSIFKIMAPHGADDAATGEDDAGVHATSLGRDLDAAELLDLSLLSLPDQTMTLALLDARHAYLASNLPNPVPHLPIGSWFQIEAFYRNDPGPDGEFTVWLDGVQVYNVVRPMAGGTNIIFALCSLVNALCDEKDDVNGVCGSPQPAELYADDIAISWSRVTPQGVLVASP